MLEWWNSWVVQLGFWGTILALLVALGFSLVRKLRDSSGSDQRQPWQLLSNFQEMREQGDISDSEYRTIHSLLQAPPSAKINESRETT
jgi:uncharacterized membrane protein